MKIKDIMINDAVFVSPDTSIPEVAEIIFKNRFHGVPVVENEKVVGIITEDDFFLKDYGDLFLPPYIRFLEKNRSAKNFPEEVKNKIKKLLAYKASDIMTSECLTVSPEMDTEELMKIIRETKFTTFPVVKFNQKLEGIVTLSDVLGTVKKGSKQMIRSLERKGSKKELYRLAEDINNLWHENITLVSRKQVKTWKGAIAIAGIALLISIIAGIILSKNRNDCGFENIDNLPATCQKFNYSQWGPCQKDGTQTRKVISRLPQGCEGGIPEVVQSCQPK